MAYSKTPTQSVYQTKTIPLVYKWDERGNTQTSTNVDSLTINAIPELAKTPTGEQIYNAYKRDGSIHIGWKDPLPATTVNDNFINPIVAVHTNTAANQVIVITWNPVLLFTTVFVLNPNVSALPDYTLERVGSISDLLLPNDNQYIFTDFVYDNGSIATVYGNGQIGTLSILQHSGPSVSNVVTSATNGDPVTLDGYVFASDESGNIWNSNLNDPATWSPSNFINAESYGDRLVRIARCGSYIVAFGTSSIEWFYDAANPTGSPLSVYPGATKRIGYIGGLAAAGDDLYFVGNTEDGATSLYKISGLKVEKIADFSSSRRLLEYAGQIRARGTFISLNGHSLYLLSVVNAGLTPPLPIYYDLETNLFGELSFQNTGQFGLSQVASAKVRSVNGFKPMNMFCVVDNNRLFGFTPNLSQDDSVNYPVFLRTLNQDFDSRRNKTLSRVLIHADRPDEAAGVSNCTLDWSVDDYRTIAGTRTVDLNSDFPVTHALGVCRKVAFSLTYTDQYPCRFKLLELDYIIGGS